MAHPKPDERPDDSTEARSRELEDTTDLSTREAQVYACLEAGLSPEDVTDRYDWGVSDYSPAVPHVRQYARNAHTKITGDADTGDLRPDVVDA